MHLAGILSGTAFAEVIDLGTAGNAPDWKITGAGAVSATSFQTNVNRTGAISLTSNAVRTGTIVPGGNLAAFNGFWYADRTFSLPQNASSISLSFLDLYGNDRAVLLLNGTIIGDVDHLGATGNGVMSFPPGPPDVPYTFTGKSSGTVTSGFKPGINTLRLIVNNTGVVPITAPTATFASATGDGTTAFLRATLSYNTSGPSAFPPLKLQDWTLTPARQNEAPLISGTVINGPALGIASLECSLDLGVSDPWTEVRTFSLDENGSANFTNISDTSQKSQNAPKLFFRIFTNTNR